MSSYHHNSFGIPTALKKAASYSNNIFENPYGLPLDISRIDDSIFVCSYPVVATKRQLIRNTLVDLITYLNISFGLGNWKLYNLKLEVGEADYSDMQLLDQLQPESCSLIIKNPLYMRLFSPTTISKYEILSPLGLQPQPVINTLKDLRHIFTRCGCLEKFPPSFLLLQEIIDDMFHFLSPYDNRICILHSKMGKSRVAVVCVAYMMKHKRLSLKKAMDTFVENRIKKKDVAVITSRSQLKYLEYQEYFLSLSLPAQTMLMNLLRKESFGTLKSIEISDPSRLLLTGLNTCWLTIKKYNPTRTSMLEVATINLTELLAEGDSEYPLQLPIPIDVADLMFEFEALPTRFYTRDKTEDDCSSRLFKTLKKEGKKSTVWVNSVLEEAQIASLVGSTLRPKHGSKDVSIKIYWRDLENLPTPSNGNSKWFNSITFTFNISPSQLHTRK